MKMRLYERRSKIQHNACKKPSLSFIPKAEYRKPISRKYRIVAKAKANQIVSNQTSCDLPIDCHGLLETYSARGIVDEELCAMDPLMSNFSMKKFSSDEPDSMDFCDVASVVSEHQRHEEFMMEELPVLRNLDDILLQARAMSKEGNSDTHRRDCSFTATLNMEVGNFMDARDDYSIYSQPGGFRRTKNTTNFHIPSISTEKSFNRRGKSSSRLQSYLKSTRVTTPVVDEEFSPECDAYIGTSLDPTVLLNTFAIPTQEATNNYSVKSRKPENEESDEDSNSYPYIEAEYVRIPSRGRYIRSDSPKAVFDRGSVRKGLEMSSQSQSLRQEIFRFQDDATKIVFDKGRIGEGSESEDALIYANENRGKVSSIEVANHLFSEDWIYAIPFQSARQDCSSVSTTIREIETRPQIQLKMYKNDSYQKDTRGQMPIHGSVHKGFNQIETYELEAEVISRIRSRKVEMMLTQMNKDYGTIISAINNLEHDIFTPHQTTEIISCLPTVTEGALLRSSLSHSYRSNRNLCDCENFLIQLMDVPQVRKKLAVIQFMQQFESNLNDFRQKVNIFQKAYKEILESTRLRIILDVYLRHLNRKNLKSHEKVSKAIDKKLLRHAASAVHKKAMSLICLQAELPSIFHAEKLQWSSLFLEMDRIDDNLDEVCDLFGMSSLGGNSCQSFETSSCNSVKTVNHKVDMLYKLPTGRFILDSCYQMTILRNEMRKSKKCLSIILELFGNDNRVNQPDSMLHFLCSLVKDFDCAMNDIVAQEEQSRIVSLTFN